MDNNQLNYSVSVGYSLHNRHYIDDCKDDFLFFLEEIFSDSSVLHDFEPKNFPYERF